MPRSGVYTTKRGSHCIKVSETKALVKFITLDIENGLFMSEESPDNFHKVYTVHPKYPIKRASDLFSSYGKTVGATQDVIEALAGLSKTSVESLQISTTVRDEIEKTTPSRYNKEEHKPDVTPKKKSKKRSKGKTGEYSSAAAMFRSLLTEGELDDDGVFKAVQDEFDLDDNRKGYVKWYKKKLVDDGVITE